MPLNTAGNAKYIKLLPWIFTVSFILITFLPRSIDDTMFMDGVTYASISRNMALGIGSFWRPFFAHSFWLPYDNGTFFSGHPPLMFGMQSVLFRMMGDTTAVENIWNLIILVFSVLLIVGIWEKLFEQLPIYRSYSWLAILSWYAMTIVYYSMPNNFLDSTMAAFCLLSCYFQLVFIKKHNASPSYIWPLMGGVSILLAFLTKGPVGLYPLAFTAIYAFCTQTFSLSSKSSLGTFKRPFLATIVMLGTFIICMGAILIYKPAYEFLHSYFQGQVIQVLFQKREQTGIGLAAHFDLLKELLQNVYFHLVAVIGLNLAAVVLKLKIGVSKAVLRVSIFSLLIGLSGILPMLISGKQYSHYLLPALPFIAIFFAALLVEKTDEIIGLKKSLWIGSLCVATLFCWGMTVKKMANLPPDTMAENAKQIKRYVERSTTIGVCHDLYQNADIHAYLQRYHLLSLTTNIDSTRYVLADSSCISRFDPKRDSVVTLQGGYSLIVKNAVNTTNAALGH